MLSLLPTLLGPSNDPLAVLRAAFAGRQTLRAEIERDGVRGTVTVGPDGALVATSGTQRIVHGPKGDAEFDTDANVYDAIRRVGPTDGRGGGVGTGRLADRVRSILPPPLADRAAFGRLPFKPTKTRGRYEADAGQARFGIEFTKGRWSAFDLRTPMASLRWNVVGFGPAPTLRAEELSISPPEGWTEFLEPDEPYPIAAPAPLPAAYRKLRPNGAKGRWLLAVLDEGIPSRGAAEWLDRGNGVPTARLKNPGAAERRALGITRVPFFILVGGDGRVVATWLGYAKGSEAALAKEIADAK